MSVLSTVDVQLSLHKRNIAKEPQKYGNAKKPVACNYEPAEVRNCTGAQYSVSHKWALWSSKLAAPARMQYYRIAGYFRGVLIFVIFVVNLWVMKVSTHKYFHHVRARATLTQVNVAHGATSSRCYWSSRLWLFRYPRPIDSALNPQGPISHSVPSIVISEVNREVETLTNKRGSYLSFTAQEKVQVAKYGSTSGIRAAVKRCLSVCLYGRGSLSSTTRKRNAPSWSNSYSNSEPLTCQGSHYVVRDRNPGPTKFKTTKKIF